MADKPKGEKFHRALILQGGGALGAYEAGVLKEWCSRLVSEDKKSGRTGPVFDIVAGASMGAVNASLLVYRALHYSRQDKTTWKPGKSQSLISASFTVQSRT